MSEQVVNSRDMKARSNAQRISKLWYTYECQLWSNDSEDLFDWSPGTSATLGYRDRIVRPSVVESSDPDEPGVPQSEH